jgi:ubiquinone/menaquinone biosynthesis C-methylase UbiE
MDVTKDLVLKVNELYHDIEGGRYENKHPEIFIDEADRWRKVGRQILSPLRQKIRLLDIGTGTGFVPGQIAEFLKINDIIICSDLSANILNVCRNKFRSANYACEFEFLKLNGETIDIASSSVDFITINSVIHHIPNFDLFFREVDRILKTGGYLVIGHEPNKRFFNNKFLYNNSRIVYFIFYPRQFLKQVSKWIGIYGLLKSVYLKIYPDRAWTSSVFKQLNQKLLADKIIDKPMSELELAEIVDFHSPNAGKFRKNTGIDIIELKDIYLTDYEVIAKETYHHIDQLYAKNAFLRWYDAWLKKIFPETGSQFFVIFKKMREK